MNPKVILQGLIAFSMILASSLAQAGQESASATMSESPKAYFGMHNDYVETDEGAGRIKVTDVVKGSPAQAAGLLPGDLIRAFDGATFRFRNEAHFIRSLWDFVPGKPLELEVLRGGDPFTMTIVPTAMEPERRREFARFVQTYDERCAEGNCTSCDEAPAKNHSKLAGAMMLHQRVQSSRKPVVVTITRDAQGRVHYSSPDMRLPQNFELSELPSFAESIEGLKLGSKMEFRAQIKKNGAFSIERIDSFGVQGDQTPWRPDSSESGIAVLYQQVTTNRQPVVVKVSRDLEGVVNYDSADTELPPDFDLSDSSMYRDWIQPLNPGEAVELEAAIDEQGRFSIGVVD